MSKTQTDDIDFYAIKCDTQDANDKINQEAFDVSEAVSNGDIARTLDTAIEMRNLGGIPTDNVVTEMETLILDKGTDQQKVDYAVELAPVFGRSVSTIYDYVQGLSEEQRSKLIGLKALNRQQALQQLKQMFPNTLVEEATEEMDNANGIASVMV